MKDKRKRTIGILGGMGPEATVLLMSRIIDMTTAEDDADHVPMIIDNNTQVPSRIKALIEKKGTNPGPVLANMAKQLEAYGARALAMPCNTAHCYAPDIEQAVRVPFLNMIELSLAQITSMQLTHFRVGILGSPAVKITGLFDKIFNKKGIECIYPDDQERMLDAIKALKKDKQNGSAKTTLTSAANELSAKNVDAILIACSEFSLIAHVVPETICCIDTIDVLAAAIITFSNGASQ
ncbi:MAG: aspartate racemase [Pseudohongiellaceae bacterium]|jgi:aspartate racemase